jgi:hypothetical protein
MSNGEIDRIPVNQLMQRYNIVRSAVYTRLDALGIKPEKIGNKAYVNAPQIKLLDEFHEFIQSGGTTAEFKEMRGIQSGENLSTGQYTGQSSGLSLVQSDLVQMVAAIAAQFANKMQPPPPEPDPLSYFEALEKAAQNGWYLRTSEVAYLLDLLPSDIQHYGVQFQEAGFIFTQVGYRSGGELAWKVSKPVR